MKREESAESNASTAYGSGQFALLSQVSLDFVREFKIRLSGPWKLGKKLWKAFRAKSSLSTRSLGKSPLNHDFSATRTIQCIDSCQIYFQLHSIKSLSLRFDFLIQSPWRTMSSNDRVFFVPGKGPFEEVVIKECLLKNLNPRLVITHNRTQSVVGEIKMIPDESTIQVSPTNDLQINLRKTGSEFAPSSLSKHILIDDVFPEFINFSEQL